MELSLPELLSEAFPCYFSVTEAVPRSWCVVTDIEGAICQSVTVVSLLMSGRAGVIGKQCGLGQYKYRNTKIQNNCNQNANLFDNGFHEKMIPGYTLNFCLTKHVTGGQKLDGGSPVDNRPSTNQIKHLIKHL